jgi:hypothetical protein
VSIRFLEHYGERPLTAFPDDLRDDLLQNPANSDLLYRHCQTRRD